jgi:hypothetical protein
MRPLGMTPRVVKYLGLAGQVQGHDFYGVLIEFLSVQQERLKINLDRCRRVRTTAITGVDR